MRIRWVTTILAIAFVSAPALSADAPAAPLGPAFTSLFNGKDLSGWQGDSRFWRVEEGAIVGETTSEVKPEKNTFLLLPGKEFGDFELRFEYQVTGFNSGVQYRSADLGNYVVKGYQCDFEDRCHKTDSGIVDSYSGMFFEEGGRNFLAQRGQAVIVRENPNNAKKPLIDVVGSTGTGDDLEKVIVREGWNRCTVIARGNQFTHIINGRVMAVGYDDDKANRRESGILAFQLHAGPPMKIRVRQIEIR